MNKVPTNPRIIVASFLLVVSVMSLPRTNRISAEPTDSRRAPDGASAAFTSDDPVLRQCRELLQQGYISRAQTLLQQERITDRRAAAEMRDLFDRVRADYGLDPGAMLEKLRQSIPDVTAEDMERWRAAGQLQCRMIDDQLAYFGREPANLFRFCPEAMRRRRHVSADAPAWKLQHHLTDVITAAARSKDARVVPIRQRVRYTLTIPADAPGLKAGAVVRAWLPFPQEYRGQRQVRLLSTSPEYKVLSATATGDDEIEGPAQRSIYFEQRVTEAGRPLEFGEEFEFVSSAFYPQLNDVQALPLPADWTGGNLAERPPHILFTPRLRQTLAGIVGNDIDPLARARKIFQYVAGNIAYCAEAEYSTIPNLSDKGLTTRRGDCGVQAMLFITLCRAAGIPARWQSGWQTRPEGGPDMHDWAEFYVIPKTDDHSRDKAVLGCKPDKWGGLWLPADVSFGADLKDNPEPGLRDFYFGHLDSYRLIVNRDYGTELVPPKDSLRSEPLDFQRGEVEIDGKNLYFPHWIYRMKVE